MAEASRQVRSLRVTGKSPIRSGDASLSFSMGTSNVEKDKKKDLLPIIACYSAVINDQKKIIDTVFTVQKNVLWDGLRSGET